MKIQLAAVLLCLLVCAAASAVVENQLRPTVTYLEASKIVDFQPSQRQYGFFENDLRIYCARGVRKTLGRYFESVELQLDIDSDDYTQYEGETPAEVRQHYAERRSLFSFNIFTQKRTRLQLSPFAQQCIGIETTLPYRVRLQQQRIDMWRFWQLIVGVLLFLYAGQLSNNSIFYYITGVTLGICSSFMLIIWLSSKLMPRRPMMYGMLIGGWSIGLYVIQRLWENVQLILQTYRVYVFWYIFITGLVSFFFCYRLGPPKNQRSKNIIKWVLQIMALVLIYAASYYEEASVVAAIMLVVLYYFPFSVFHKVRALFTRLFPPKPRLLTSEEFYEQGVRETAKALEELRTYASSPDCKQWKVITKLKDPLRFADFVEGSSHLRDEEISQFEQSQQDELDQLDYSDSDLEVDLDDSQEEPRLIEYYRRLNVPQRRNITYELSEEEVENKADEQHYSPRAVNNRSANNLRYTPNLNHSRPIYSSAATLGAFTPRQRNSPMRQHVNYQTPSPQTTATRVVSASRASLSRSARMVSSAQRNIGNNSAGNIQLRNREAHRNISRNEYSGESDEY